MAKNTTVAVHKRERVLPFEITSADGTNYVDLCLGDAEDSNVFEICITSDETTSRNLTIVRDYGGGVEANMKIVSVAANQGNNTSTPDPLRLINTDSGFVVSRILDKDQNYNLALPYGQKFKAKLDVALTSGKKVKFAIRIKDF